MVSRNLSLPHKFICFTEDPEGLDSQIEIFPLEEMGLAGDFRAWWYKLKVFDKDLGIQGTLLFLDLDVTIISNIDCLFEYNPNKFCIIQDFLRIKDPNYAVKNSSVFRMEIGSHPTVWDDFVKFKDQITAGFAGDQDWISARINEAVVWPHDWVISYRWELKKQLENDPSKRISYELESQPPKDCCILVFHGTPSPHEVVDIPNPDPLIKRHWN